MILAPSEIHFLKDASKVLLSPDPGTIEDISYRFRIGQERLPKVQVASKDGLWFALNNSYLHILRELQRLGKCARVCVEVVPLTKVPASLQQGMVVGKEDFNIWDDGMTRQPANRMSSEYCDDARKGLPTTFSEQNNESLCSSEEWQGKVIGYQRTDDELYGMSTECLANTALLEGLDSESDDSTSYTSTDYSDYYDEEDDIDTDSEYEDEFMCNVCEKNFRSIRSLSSHQREKRHFGCSVCKKNFNSHPTLETHKDELNHWSQEEGEDNDSRKQAKPKDTVGDDCEDITADQEPSEYNSLL